MIKRHTQAEPRQEHQGRHRRARGVAARVQRAAGVPRVRQAQTRVGRKILGDGRKVRICRKCEGVVDK